MQTRLAPPAGSARTSGLRTIERLFYYWRTAALIFAVVVLIGILLAIVLPAKYRSDARLLALGSDTYDVRSNPNAATGSEAFKPQEVVNVEMQLLASRDLHRAALLRSGVSPADAHALEVATDRFGQHLKVTQVSAANVIELSYVDRDPDRAAATLRNLLDVYFEARTRVLTSGRVAQLGRARDKARIDLDRASAALRAYQAKHQIADIDAQIAGAVSVDTALRQQRSQSAADVSGGTTRLSQLRKSASDIPATVELYHDDTEANRAIAEMQGQVLQLEAKRSDLASRYMQGSPLIDQIDKQIGGLRTAITEHSGTLSEAHRVGRNTYYDAAIDRVRENRASVSGDSARRGQLGRELAASSARLRTLNDVAGTIANLKLQQDVATDRYRLLSTQIEQAGAKASDAGAGNSNVRIIQQPNVPDERENSVGLLIAGSVLFGLLLGAAGLFVRATSRRAVLDADEASASLDVPVVADLRQPLRVDASGIRGIATKLADGGGAKTVALVATDQGDLETPIRALIGELEQANPGSVVTITFEEAAYHFDDGQFTRLIASDVVRARVRVGSTAWSIEETGAKLLAELRERYRWTVLVIPPLPRGAENGDALGQRIKLATMADVVLLIVGADQARSAAAQRISAMLREVGRPLRGLVLTGGRLGLPAFVSAF